MADDGTDLLERAEGPVADHAGWVVGAICGDAAVNADEVAARFTERFLTAIGTDETVAFLAEVRAGLAGGRVIDVEQADPRELDLLVASADGAFEAEVHLATEPNATGLAGLSVRPWTGDGATVDLRRIEPPPLVSTGDALGPVSAALVTDSLDTARRRLPMAGLVATVVHPGGVCHVTTGWSDVDGPAPWTEHTLHRIGSITKPVVALALTQAVIDGRLALDALVDDLLDDIDVDRRVTLEHLLTHTSGLRSLESGGVPGDVNPVTVAQLFADGFTVANEPGTTNEYSNVGFTLAGEILARLRRASLHDAVGSVTGPAGMADTHIGEAADLPPGRSRARPYRVRFGAVLDEDPIAITMPGAGAAWSTATDMARLARLVIDGAHGSAPDGIAPDAVATAIEPRVDAVSGPFHQGLGFAVGQIQDRRIVFHNGGWPGWSATLMVAPDHDRAVYLATNTTGRTGGGDDLDAVALRLLLALIEAGGA